MTDTMDTNAETSTMILTNYGYVDERAVQVTDKYMVWDGEKFCRCIIEDSNEPVYKVELKNGMSLTCGASHRWMLKKGEGEGEQTVEVLTSDLTVDSIIQDIIHPIDLRSKEPLDGDAYVKGAIASQNYPRAASDNVVVPLTSPFDTKIRWLSGFFRDAGGVENNMSGEKTRSGIFCWSSDFALIRDIQLMLATLQAHSVIYNCIEDGACIIAVDSIATKRLVSLGLFVDPPVSEEACKKEQETNEDKFIVSAISECHNSSSKYILDGSNTGQIFLNGIMTKVDVLDTSVISSESMEN